MASEAQNLKKLGNDAFEEKDFDTALKNYEEAIEKEPNEITNHLKAASVHFEMNNFDECIKVCLEASKIGKANGADSKLMARAFAGMGQAYKLKDSSDLDKALENYEKVIELDPNEIYYYNNMADVHFELKNYTKCIKLCLKASKIGQEKGADPKNIAKCYEIMAKAHQEFGNLKMAKQAFEKAQKENRTSDYDEYLSEIETKIENQVEYLLCLGTEALNKKDFAEALKFFGKGLDLDPTKIELYLETANTYYHMKNFQLCVGFSEKTVNIGKENGADSKLLAKAYEGMGDAFEEIGNLKKAKLAYEKSFKEYPKQSLEKHLLRITKEIETFENEKAAKELVKAAKEKQELKEKQKEKRKRKVSSSSSSSCSSSSSSSSSEDEKPQKRSQKAKKGNLICLL